MRKEPKHTPGRREVITADAVTVAMLREMAIGQTLIIELPSIAAIESAKSTAYRLQRGEEYRFTVSTSPNAYVMMITKTKRDCRNKALTNMETAGERNLFGAGAEAMLRRLKESKLLIGTSATQSPVFARAAVKFLEESSENIIEFCREKSELMPYDIVTDDKGKMTGCKVGFSLD